MRVRLQTASLSPLLSTCQPPPPRTPRDTREQHRPPPWEPGRRATPAHGDLQQPHRVLGDLQQPH